MVSICALHGDLGFLLSPVDLVVALIAVIIANDAMGTPLTALWTAIPLSDPEDFQAGRPVRASLDPYGPSGEAQTFVAWSVVVVHTEVIRHA